VQQQGQKDLQQSNKLSESKFDKVMAQQTQATQATSQVQKTAQVQKAQQVSQAQRVQDVAKAEKAQLNKTSALTPKAVDGANKAQGGLFNQVVSGLEQHQNSMNTMLEQALAGKNQKMSFQQLTMLQMQVYQYSQEMDLASKVVEKATSGLKDTLKTQV
jgi:transcription termination factor NusB